MITNHAVLQPDVQPDREIIVHRRCEIETLTQYLEPLTIGMVPDDGIDSREATLTGEDDLHRQEQATDICDDSSNIYQGSVSNSPIPTPEPSFSPTPKPTSNQP